VTNGCGNASATVTVTVVAAPNAGSPGAVSFCSGDAPADLFGSLGGTPDAGGTWAPALASGTGVFNPAVDAGGVYSYTVSASCGNATSDVTVTLNPSPDAGTDGAISFCTSDPSTDLFTSLGGTPDAGGTWSPAMASGTGVFNPATDPAGVYTYTVTNGCGSIAANVTVTINSNPSPGTAGSIAFCATDPTADLFNSLGGAPTLGGSWSPALASGTGVFNPAVDAAGVYTYSVNACGGGVLTADVTVTLNPAPDAGTDNTTTLCDNAPTVDLFTLVLGTPSAGGTWSPSMASGTGVFDPATDPAGVYVYTVTNSCGSASSNITVTVNSCAPPAAGFTVLDTLVCLGECFTFLDTTKFAPTTWHWDFGGATTPDTSIVQNPSICVDSVGTFVITLTASNVNGTSTATMNLVVADMPSVTIVQDTTIDMNGTAFLTSNVTPTGGDYTWSSPTDDIPCPSCQSNYLTPLLTSEYILNYVTIEGCEATDTALVTVLFMDLVDVPNGFSPNSDGNNDLLFVKGEGITSMNFVIHNRYGQQVFQSDAQDVGWDGSMNGNPQNPGVFVWYLQYSLIDGTSNFKKGNVTLIK
jgi:gliding motility-associated-like protein